MREDKSRLKIESFNLNEQYFYVHKTGIAETGFGLDHSSKLIENGFGVYSAVKLKEEIGPLRSDFYRIALCLDGSLHVEIGVETFLHQKNTIHFNVPDRLFLMKNKSEDLASYYLFFTGAFLEEVLPEIKLNANFPFFNYLNVPFFQLSETESAQIQALFVAISAEVNSALADNIISIKLLIVQMLIAAKRSYLRQAIAIKNESRKETQMVLRYKKLIAQYYITLRTVKEYAAKMAVSPNHLSKIIKQETGKTAGGLIDEMLIMEIKALLRYTELNVSEIAYQLDFADTSHLAKFFKRYTLMAPLEYRKKFE